MYQEKSKKPSAKRRPAKEYFLMIEDQTTHDYVVFYGSYEGEDKPVKQRIACTPAMSHIDVKSFREAINTQTPGTMITCDVFPKNDEDISEQSEQFSQFMKFFYKGKNM